MKFYLQQIITPDYREGLFQELAKFNSLERFVCSGEIGYDPSQRSHEVCRAYVQPVKNRFFLQHRVCWQQGLVQPLLEAERVILNFNVRTLSNWKIAASRHKRGKKTLLWGHVSGRLPQHLTRCLYVAFLSKCDGFITYTDSDKQLLQSAFPNLPAWTAPNACLSEDESVPAQGVSPDDATDVLYVGRLKAEKKPLLLAKAFKAAVEQGQLDEAVRLVYVGSGSEADAIQAYARAHGFEGRLRMHGHVADVEQLRQLYGRSFVAVSPGYASLSVTQALAFGTWMLLARDEPHSPEIEAVKPGWNGDFFPSDNPPALANALRQAWEARESHFLKRDKISSETRRRYSFESMARAFHQALAECYNQ